MSTELRLTPGSEVMQFQEIESNAAIGHVNATAILDIGEDTQLEVTCDKCQVPAFPLTPTPILQGSRSSLRFHCAACKAEWSLVLRNCNTGHLDVRVRPICGGAK